MQIGLKLNCNSYDGGIELMPSIKLKFNKFSKIDRRFIQISLLGLTIMISSSFVFTLSDRHVIFNTYKCQAL